MKPIRILIFIFSVILLLGVTWYFFPSEVRQEYQNLSESRNQFGEM